jgi:hypothetical protein
MVRLACLLLVSLLISGCAGKILQVERSDEKLKVGEFEDKVEVKEAEVIPPPPEPTVKEAPEKAAKKKPSKVRPSKIAKKPEPKAKGPRQPEMEDDEGFNGRRPLVDPYRVGEKITFDVSYFNVTAGVMTLEVKPFVTVNGQRAYHFELNGNTSSFFSKIYEVQDKAVTYLSYDELVPLSLSISIKESKQLGETRTFFDWKTMKASYWQKKIVKDKGERSKQIDWEIKPYSQNVISAAYYLRNFQLKPGKKLAFRVADEGKNIVFTAEVLRKEKLETPAGTLDTVVVKPQVTADGAFKPIGDILIWLTDDDRKFIVRLESKIKIGTIVAKLKSIEKGRD